MALRQLMTLTEVAFHDWLRKTKAERAAIQEIAEALKENSKAPEPKTPEPKTPEPELEPEPALEVDPAAQEGLEANLKPLEALFATETLVVVDPSPRLWAIWYLFAAACVAMYAACITAFSRVAGSKAQAKAQDLLDRPQLATTSTLLFQRS